LLKSNKEMEKKVRVKTSNYFYTEEELQQLQDAINSKEYKTDYKIAHAFSKKFGRSANTLYNKICAIRGKNVRGKVKVVAKKTVKTKQTPVAKIEVIEEVKPLTLPQGMTYQGKAKKVELHADHFRVYF